MSEAQKEVARLEARIEKLEQDKRDLLSAITKAVAVLSDAKVRMFNSAPRSGVCNSVRLPGQENQGG